MKITTIFPLLFLFLFLCFISCDDNTVRDDDNVIDTEIEGFQLLEQASGLWQGTNETPFGNFDFFVWDYRPISSSHVHAISEGATAQTIIASYFIADYNGKKQIFCRNGGFLGDQYRASYFVLDSINETSTRNFYRLSDVLGGANRSYVTLTFENNTMSFKVYTSNGGTVSPPQLHMNFTGTNIDPSVAETATTHFNFPQEDSEVNLEGAFDNVFDENTATFFEEANDPFPKSAHGYIADLTANASKTAAIQDDALILYLSIEPIIANDGSINFTNLENSVVRIVEVDSDEAGFDFSYVHPDTYYITAFSDKDEDMIPSSGDYTSVSKAVTVNPDTNASESVVVDILLD